MKKHRTTAIRLLLVVLIALLWLPTICRAEVLITPELFAKGGYTSNRFLVPGGEGSPYAHVSPSVGLYWFDRGGLEGTASVYYAYTNYTESGFLYSQESGFKVSVLKDMGRTAWNLAISGNRFEDRGLPEDDSDWLGVSPSFSWEATDTLTAGLALSASRTWFDSLTTSSGDKQRTQAIAITPSVQWAAGHGVTLWSELRVEEINSNQAGEDFTYKGISAGAYVTPNGPGRMGLWVKWATEDYADEGTSLPRRRRDSPFTAGGWASYRIAPWAEIEARGSWLSHESNVESEDYTAWNAGIGVRFIWDWDLPGRSRAESQ